jgi:hypothetical protein
VSLTRRVMRARVIGVVNGHLADLQGGRRACVA